MKRKVKVSLRHWGSVCCECLCMCSLVSVFADLRSGVSLKARGSWVSFHGRCRVFSDPPADLSVLLADFWKKKEGNRVTIELIIETATFHKTPDIANFCRRNADKRELDLMRQICCILIRFLLRRVKKSYVVSEHVVCVYDLQGRCSRDRSAHWQRGRWVPAPETNTSVRHHHSTRSVSLRYEFLFKNVQIY